MKTKLLVALYALCLTASAGMPQLHTLRLGWDAYVMQPGTSNGVIVIQKSTYLGTGPDGPVYTPYKPTAYTPSTRTNMTISLLPGTYHFRSVAQGQPLPESLPSNEITTTIAP